MGPGILGLRIDIDTLSGARKGLPRLLDLLGGYGIKASLFMAQGPDHSGYALKRIFRKNFLAKVRKVKPYRSYGMRTLVSGILIPGKEIAVNAGKIIARADFEGHEFGIHGWDHFAWQNRLMKMTDREIESEYRRASTAFLEISGKIPHASAVPGWVASNRSILLQESLNLLYASDVRGWSPFYPLIDNKILKTLQVPVTLPTLDECLGTSCDNPAQFNELILSFLKPGSVHIHAIHAELEGGLFLSNFRKLIEEVQRLGIIISTLAGIAGGIMPDKIPVCRITHRAIPGRSGKVCCQGAVSGSDAMIVKSGSSKAK